MELYKSPVKAIRKPHGYLFGDKPLQGITGMLSRQLFDEEYDGVDEWTMEQKADFGHYVHGCIEMLDHGVPVSNKYTEAYENIKNLYGLTSIANEYVVSDEKEFASAIDIVMQKGDKVWLIDTKTCAKLNHEKVAWQLSIYKTWFELFNPTLTVEGVACLHFKVHKTGYNEETEKNIYALDDCVLVDLTTLLRSADDVNELLKCEIEGRKFEDPHKSELVVTTDVVDEVCRIEQSIKKLEDQQKELRAGLLALMQKHNIKSFKTSDGRLLMTRKLESVRQSFDSARFKKDYPELYEEYIKEARISESITIKVND